MGAPMPILGLSTMLCGYAKLRYGALPAAVSTGAQPDVVAVIPALNEERTIPYAIVSLATQTVPPDRLVVVDDGSTDSTGDVVEGIRSGVPFDVELRTHETPRGKTASIKEVARAATEERLFVLDADTYLESETYLEALLGEHERDDVACAFGRVRPSTRADKAAVFDSEIRGRYGEDDPARVPLEDEVESWETPGSKLRYYLGRWPVERYRDTLYRVEQGFIKEAYMRLFGTALFPAGCGVLYDRERLVEVFDGYEASLGDNLTNSEDIFLGFAFAHRGLTNVQVDRVSMRTAEPSLRELPRQTYLWGSAYLQSAYYFRRLSTRVRGGDDPRRRPYGRAVLAQFVDGLYPSMLLLTIALLALQIVDLEWLFGLLAFELSTYAVIAVAVARERKRALLGALVSVPVRLFQLPMGTYVYLRVVADLLRGNRSWGK
jgi:glycosyltransferase involved in cell wall biosynthesis